MEEELTAKKSRWFSACLQGKLPGYVPEYLLSILKKVEDRFAYVVNL